jgi:pyridoxamine 5'-phosphate oxidase
VAATPDDDPIALLAHHYARALEREDFDAARVALATANAHGAPSVRFVLVREIEPDGLYFYTSYESQKARELDENPRAALAWHWASLGIQVRVAGAVERADAARSDAYFAKRPRGSQLGAWASPQSQPIASREVLEARVRELEIRFADADVPRPETWGGYRLVPERIELWHDGEHRLHDRFAYERTREGGWRRTRLAP